MRSPADMADRHSQGLAELAALGLALAREVQGRAMVASDETIGDLTLAFQRVSRSVRQTFALEARLERERRGAERAAAVEARAETLRRVQRKRAQIRDALGPAIWTEAEGREDEAEDLAGRLEGLLMDQELITEAFADAPLEDCLAQLRVDLGLAAPANGEADVEAGPLPHGPPAPQPWRSSA